MSRTASLDRRTRETEVQVTLTLDGTGRSRINTGVGFLDHMLDQLARHGLFDLEVQARGDLPVDAHHTVEDVGIALGQVWREALGERRGICRFGEAHVPLDEALARVVVDLSNRPHLTWQVVFPTEKVGQWDTELFREWFAAFADNGRLCLHVASLAGSNSHHIAESCFKALAVALRKACALDPGRGPDAIPSTKGTLSV
ncbi:MAG: imidazoleglycerol-phosphate dehydratase HisB [Magnetococcales bacterium]|nr:imidazoleglycerol-phosphate dehydratase HisB [Magnetococcales bacterium]MBF0156381.1 imidazoleglycerol-phosphate dehydratase HisB [Magnetococcales bacterium]